MSALFAPPEPHPTPRAGAGFDLRVWIRLLAERWRLIALAAVVCAAAGLVHYYLTPRQYRATTMLQISQKRTIPVSADSNPWLDHWASLKFFPTQYRLLRSRGLAEEVVVQLDLINDPAFNPGASELLPAPVDTERSAVDDDAYLATLANRLRARVEVEPIDGTELLTITYVANDPELTARIANGYARTFIDWSTAERVRSVGEASTFLDQEIERLTDELREKERLLREYGREADRIPVEGAGDTRLDRLRSLNEALAGARARVRSLQARYTQLRNDPDAVVASRSPAPSITTLEAEKLRLQGQYEELLKTYREDWPEVVALRTRIEEQDDRIARAQAEAANLARSAARAELRAAQGEQAAIQSDIDTLKEEALDLGVASIDYDNLRLEIEAARGELARLNESRSAAGRSARLESSGESTVRVVDRALVPTRAFRPSLRVNMTLGLVAGLLIGTGGVLLVHFLDRTVKSAEELESLLDLPVLAVVPDIEAKASSYGGYRRVEPTAADEGARTIERVPHRHPSLPVSEAYRSLRTGLLLSSAEELRVIAVTSAGAGEGKTATAVNLAIVLAQLGEKVLLVDADLRKPRVHRVFETENRSGLVDAIAAGGRAEATLQSTEIANLTLCTSGPHPPNPSELLGSARLRTFLSDVKGRFDRVVIDTPPVLAVTDAILVGSVADGTILTCRAGKVDRDEALTCRDQLRLSGVRILGTVFNCYRPHFGEVGRRYRYYQAYGETDASAATDSAA